jgi:hypothetical protein
MVESEYRKVNHRFALRKNLRIHFPISTNSPEVLSTRCALKEVNPKKEEKHPPFFCPRKEETFTFLKPIHLHLFKEKK